jgi:hypothetical protein
MSQGDFDPLSIAPERHLGEARSALSSLEERYDLSVAVRDRVFVVGAVSLLEEGGQLNHEVTKTIPQGGRAAAQYIGNRPVGFSGMLPSEEELFHFLARPENLGQHFSTAALVEQVGEGLTLDKLYRGIKGIITAQPGTPYQSLQAVLDTQGPRGDQEHGFIGLADELPEEIAAAPESHQLLYEATHRLLHIRAHLAENPHDADLEVLEKGAQDMIRWAAKVYRMGQHVVDRSGAIGLDLDGTVFDLSDLPDQKRNRINLIWEMADYPWYVWPADDMPSPFNATPRRALNHFFTVIRQHVPDLAERVINGDDYQKPAHGFRGTGTPPSYFRSNRPPQLTPEAERIALIDRGIMLWGDAMAAFGTDAVFGVAPPEWFRSAWTFLQEQRRKHLDPLPDVGIDAEAPPVAAEALPQEETSEFEPRRIIRTWKEFIAETGGGDFRMPLIIVVGGHRLDISQLPPDRQQIYARLAALPRDCAVEHRLILDNLFEGSEASRAQKWFMMNKDAHRPQPTDVPDAMMDEYFWTGSGKDRKVFAALRVPPHMPEHPRIQRAAVGTPDGIFTDEVLMEKRRLYLNETVTIDDNPISIADLTPRDRYLLTKMSEIGHVFDPRVIQEIVAEIFDQPPQGGKYFSEMLTRLRKLDHGILGFIHTFRPPESNRKALIRVLAAPENVAEYWNEYRHSLGLGPGAPHA